MKIIIINSLGKDKFLKCFNSLTKTIKFEELIIIKEKEFREKTLNYILSTVKINDDLLIVSDDIEFKDGWYEKINKYKHDADILGMCMLYPDSNIIQDCGYDLININGKIKLEPLYRGKNYNEVKDFGLRYCDGLCGCFLYINKHVFDMVKSFQEYDGCNRWGEFIFISEARKKGAKIGVINHFLFHDGNSTKNNRDIQKSSISYQIEKKIWDNIINKYIDLEWIKSNRITMIDSSLIFNLNDKSKNILIYGIGTVAEELLNNTNNKFTLATGLPEESNMNIRGNKVYYIDDINLYEYDWIIITPLYIGEKIYNNIFDDEFELNYKGKVSFIKKNINNNIIKYEEERRF
jgi:hypothetical protein